MKLKKSVVFLLLLVLFCTNALCLSACNNEKKDLKVHFNENGTLRIAQFADLHFTNDEYVGDDYRNDKVERTIAFMDYVVETTKPDLIVLGGDNINYGDTNLLKWLIKTMDKYKTPWTFAFGNHDSETTRINYRKKDFSKVLNGKESKYILYNEDYVEKSKYTRYGNFSIPIYDGERLLGAIILLDSGVCDYDTNEYEPITMGQIQWYECEIDRLQEIYKIQENNTFNTIPTIVFSHIQLQEHYDACVKALESSGAEFIIEQDLPKWRLDSILKYAPKQNTGFFDSMLKKNSTFAYFAGHMHTLALQVKMQGIVLGFAPQTGFSKSKYEYDTPRSTYVYEFNKDFNFTTIECREQVDL